MAGRRKKNHSGGEKNDGGWEIVFSGFVLILLSFFIMLSSFASIEDAKVMKFVKSFSTAVSIFTGGLSFNTGKTIVLPSAGLVDKNNDLAIIFGKIKALIEQLNLKKDVTVTHSERGAVLRLSDTVLFDLGKADLLQGAIPFLHKIGAMIRQTSCEVHIEGHTDDLPIRTTRFPSNWELSTARAVNCLRFFVEKENISPHRVSAVGFGEFHPLVVNDDPENRAKNRRVEIVFVPSDAESPRKAMPQ